MRRLQNFAVVLLVMAMGCTGSPRGSGGDPGGAPFPADGVALDDHRTLGSPVVVDNLTVWPVFTDTPQDVGEFLTLEEAQEQDLAVVSEVGAQVAEGEEAPNAQGGGEPNQVGPNVEIDPANLTEEQVAEVIQQAQQVVIQQGGATVSTLQIENKGDRPILVLAGTVVKGGKQDRQIGQDFVIQPKAKVPVDAFCIERGRWDATRDGKLTQGFFQAQGFVANPSVRLAAQYDADQGKVWENVAGMNHAAMKAPATGTLLAAIEEDDSEAKATRERLEEAVRAHFAEAKLGERALVGFAYAIAGQPKGARAFAHPDVFAKQFSACLKTMCMDAELVQRGQGDGEAAEPQASPEAMVKLVEDLRSGKKQTKMAPTNRNVYFKSDQGGNASCQIRRVLEDGTEEWVDLAEDWTASE